MKNEEVKLLDIDIETAVLLIISLLVSIYLTTERKKRLENKKTFLNEKDDQNILLINRLFALIIFCISLYDTYEFYKIAKSKNEDLFPYKLQLLASILGVVAALIVIYAVLYNYNSISNLENPTI